MISPARMSGSGASDFWAFVCQPEDIEVGFLAFVNKLMLISTFQEFPKRFERSKAIERLERLEPATAQVSAASLIVNQGGKRLR
jgi:hypothetical protein